MVRCCGYIIAFLFSVTVGASSASLIPPNDSYFVQNVSSKQIRLMSYNVNNLFDAVHDEGAFDWTFLPKEYPGKLEQCQTIKQKHYAKECAEVDWTDAKVAIKIQQIKRVIMSHGGKPDVLALQEIENKNVINMLAKATGYEKFLVTDYGSHRGVDVAILYNSKKLELVEEAYVQTPGRDPLRAQFRIKNTKEVFYVYVNHWLAQSAPEEYRKETAIALADDIDFVSSKNPNVRLVAMGDFNVTDDEEDIFTETLLDKNWKYALADVHSVARAQFPQMSKNFPDGSYYFSGKNLWRRFDRFFASKGFLKGSLKMDLSSYRVIYSEFLTGIFDYKIDFKDPNSPTIPVRIPLKYNFTDNPKYSLGFSDHLPISIILNY